MLLWVFDVNMSGKVLINGLFGQGRVLNVCHNILKFIKTCDKFEDSTPACFVM